MWQKSPLRQKLPENGSSLEDFLTNALLATAQNLRLFLILILVKVVTVINRKIESSQWRFDNKDLM